MVAVPSVMLPLGTPAPDFDLRDVTTGSTVTLGSFAGSKAVLVMFISRHCPYVQHIKDGLTAIDRDYAGRSLGILAISSNDVVNYPADSPDNLRAFAAGEGWRFPVCYDESQQIALAYSAACTPDFFLFDADRKLAYRGQLDDSRPGNGRPVTGADLRAAIDALLSGRQPDGNQRASIGCNIKWKKGNEPPYFRH
jgi:peroxiredoxin